MQPEAKILLETKDLVKRFGGLTVINNINLTIREGEILGLIGPNGAGKSTFFNLVTGVLTPTSGKIYFDGKDITRLKPHKVAALGIGRTFQLNPLFGEFTVFENVVAAHHLHPHSSVLDVYFNTRKYRENEKKIAESTEQILEMLGLSNVRNELAKNLPHGYQKILGVARAVATQPKLLMLDEPLGGMNPEEIAFSIDVIGKLRDSGMTVLIVEHNMQILDLCDRVFVISFGEKIFEGTPDEVRNDETVIKTYFGGVAV
ncbi:MAG: ABC transporter ATP-binding protein [Oscillospiraceae bacterium]|jgi:branched-chain amino acid transport system ATP-binding protein